MPDTKNLKAVCKQAAVSLDYSQLKPQELEAIKYIAGSKDVFVVF